MPDRRSQKTLAVFLGWLLPLFWCMGMVPPINGEHSGRSYEFVDLEIISDGSKSQWEVISEEKEQHEEVQLKETQEEEEQKEKVLKGENHQEKGHKGKGQVEKAQVEKAQQENKYPLLQNRLITVQPGDTLSSLALRNKTTVQELIRLNGITQPDKIFAGQKLFVPVRDTSIYGRNLASLSRGRVPVTEEELELLARVIHGEARGEDFIGQVAVGAVVLNRVQSSGFPNTIREVIYQKNAFTAVNDKQINLEPNETAYQAAIAAIMGEDPTGGAVYYYNPKTATDRWIKTRPVIKTIGNHTFSI